MRWLGTDRLTWSDLKVETSRRGTELSRILNPSEIWDDPDRLIAAEISSLVSSVRFLLATMIFGIDDVPSHYWPATYGPRRADSPGDQTDTADANDGGVQDDQPPPGRRRTAAERLAIAEEARRRAGSAQ